MLRIISYLLLAGLLGGCAGAWHRVGPIRHGVERAYTQIERKGMVDQYSYVVAGDQAAPFGMILGARLGYALSDTPIGSGSGLAREAYISYLYAFKRFAVGLAGGAAWTTAFLQDTKSVDVWGFPIDVELHYGLVPRMTVYGGIGRWLASSVTASVPASKTHGGDASADSTTTRGRAGVLFNLRQGHGDEWDVTLRLEGQYTHAAGGTVVMSSRKVPSVAGLSAGQMLSMDSTALMVELMFTSF